MLFVRVRRKGSRRRSWCFRMRCPVGCGCAPALTLPPRLWCWTPVSPLTYLTASTLATPTWCASLVCQVGWVVTGFVCAGWVSLSVSSMTASYIFYSIRTVLTVRFVMFIFQVCWRPIIRQVRRYPKTRRLAKVTGCHWPVVWPVWAPQAAMVPWQQRGPPPSPKRPAQVQLTRQLSTAASVAQVVLCWENALIEYDLTAASIKHNGGH